MTVKITDAIRAKVHAECPACGSPRVKHHPEDDNDFEHWEYACEAVIVRDSHDMLSVEEDCRHALTKALTELALPASTTKQ